MVWPKFVIFDGLMHGLTLGTITMNLKFIIIFGLFLLGTLTTKAQMGTMVVSEFKKVEIVIEGNLAYYDLNIGYSDEYKDTIRVISLSTFDSVYSGEVGDSIRFYLKKYHPEAKRNLQPKADQLFPIGDTNYFYVGIRTVCKDFEVNSCSSVDETHLHICRSLIGPMYYLNGKAIFSEDPIENKRMKKQYKKANRKRKNWL
jgi:hypothetical protein